jgi:predicted nucleic acid-binding protein
LIKPLVFDTTPLIYVIRVSLAESLKGLRDPKILPHSVYDELLRGEPLGKPEALVIRELVENGVLNLTRPADTSLVQRLIRLAAEDERKPLHRAEADALALAKELRGIVISDDHAARSTARLIHAELHGTGYLLGRMYQEGRISKEEAIAKVREMRRAGWRLSEDDYHAILDHLRTQ